MIRTMRIFEKMYQKHLSQIEVREDHYDNLREKKYFSLEKARSLRMQVHVTIAILFFINIPIVTIMTIMVI